MGSSLLVDCVIPPGIWLFCQFLRILGKFEVGGFISAFEYVFVVV